MESAKYPKTLRTGRLFLLLKTTVLLLFALFAYFSGIVLPYPVVSSVHDISLHETSKKYTPKTMREQIGNEKIAYKRRPAQVLAAQTTTQKPSEWGVAKQIGEHTWTIQVGTDQEVGTASEILQALNAYRARHGSGALALDPTLVSYAQGRADMFNVNNATDAHAGFMDYINNQDGFKKLGFMSLGENSSLGYHVEAVHLIEWVYAGDAPHDQNQLNPSWTHVGIGVAGLATDLVFGGRRM
jgi:uncharacterized protein YkwD